MPPASKGALSAGRLTIARKLVLLIALPIAGLGFFAATAATEKLSVVNEAGHARALAGLSVTINQLVHELQTERGRTSGFLASKGQTGGQDLTQQRTVTDQRVNGLKSALQSFDVGSYGPSLKSLL